MISILEARKGERENKKYTPLQASEGELVFRIFYTPFEQETIVSLDDDDNNTFCAFIHHYIHYPPPTFNYFSHHHHPPPQLLLLFAKKVDQIFLKGFYNDASHSVLAYKTT